VNLKPPAKMNSAAISPWTIHNAMFMTVLPLAVVRTLSFGATPSPLYTQGVHSHCTIVQNGCSRRSAARPGITIS
jgi:hypothetical protein